MGFGVQAGKLIFSHLGVRAGFNFFNYGVNNSVSDVSYSARLRFQNIPVMLDLFPWSRGSFHFTGGVVFDQNRITGTGQPDQSGDLSINHDRLLAVAGRDALGGHPLPLDGGLRRHRVRDAGAELAHGVHGRPGRDDLDASRRVDVTGAGSNPQLQSDLQAQQASTQSDVNKYAKIYPVISMGLAVRL